MSLQLLKSSLLFSKSRVLKNIVWHAVSILPHVISFSAHSRFLPYHYRLIQSPSCRQIWGVFWSLHFPWPLNHLKNIATPLGILFWFSSHLAVLILRFSCQPLPSYLRCWAPQSLIPSLLSSWIPCFALLWSVFLTVHFLPGQHRPFPWSSFISLQWLPPLCPRSKLSFET